MECRIKELLISSDTKDMNEIVQPADFSIDNEFDKIKVLLEEVGKRFPDIKIEEVDLINYAIEATMYCSLTVQLEHEKMVIMFSKFGKLFTASGYEKTERIDHSLINFIKSAGYRYIPYVNLNEPYDGVNGTFLAAINDAKEHYPDLDFTWINRFFSYQFSD